LSHFEQLFHINHILLTVKKQKGYKPYCYICQVLCFAKSWLTTPFVPFIAKRYCQICSWVTWVIAYGAAAGATAHSAIWWLLGCWGGKVFGGYARAKV